MLIFFFNDTATTEIYTLSLHDALPICGGLRGRKCDVSTAFLLTTLVVVATPGTGVLYTLAAGLAHGARASVVAAAGCTLRSEEHTSELQSRQYLVCRLLLEKKKNTQSPLNPRGHIWHLDDHMYDTQREPTHYHASRRPPLSACQPRAVTRSTVSLPCRS